MRYESGLRQGNERALRLFGRAFEPVVIQLPGCKPRQRNGPDNGTAIVGDACMGRPERISAVVDVASGRIRSDIGKRR